ncbi:MAG: DUF6090 family protein, partial [Flavobacteriaceae bacterium]
MIKFFRHIRQQLLTENKFSKYLLYAIGEIILVVIGILIALQLNNLNEKRSQRFELNNIYKTIKSDLQKDSVTVNNLIQYYESLDSLLIKVVTKELPKSHFDSITAANYLDCKLCRSLVTGFAVFPIQQNGYQLLKNYADNIDMQTDSLSVD